MVRALAAGTFRHREVEVVMASIAQQYQPTLEELAAAYRRGKLYKRSISFQLALANPLLRKSLECSAKARHRSEEIARGRALPVQTRLI